jgi:hypothetical protein
MALLKEAGSASAGYPAVIPGGDMALILCRDMQLLPVPTGITSSPAPLLRQRLA